ncbi:MAG: cob(I)yrinic acid a,c-diamide adenosyltransferase [Candidatus Marsarchaeota archaeon]|nr:cob(I)yrinic acid a,c-diamide adenosyltransferase [Candidatus Marsarchaeota archaeon]
MKTPYYTGKGDDGTTHLLGSGPVKKTNPTVVAIGDIDELNSFIGLAIANTSDERINNALQLVQDRLYTIGAELAGADGNTANLKTKINTISSVNVKELEDAIEELDSELPKLKEFVLPGGSLSSANLHVARAIARRAERSVVRITEKQPHVRINHYISAYLNRLSSYLFAAARYMNNKEGIDEPHPTYTR